MAASPGAFHANDGAFVLVPPAAWLRLALTETLNVILSADLLLAKKSNYSFVPPVRSRAPIVTVNLFGRLEEVVTLGRAPSWQLQEDGSQS